MRSYGFTSYCKPLTLHKVLQDRRISPVSGAKFKLRVTSADVPDPAPQADRQRAGATDGPKPALTDGPENAQMFSESRTLSGGQK